MKSLLRQVKEIVSKEIAGLAALYPNNIKKITDPKLLHAASMLSFYNNETTLNQKFLNKLLNLMAGLELLALGVKIHSFNPGDFINLVKDIKSAHANDRDSDKNAGKYTIDLLFGDIFFSRASIYIMRYNDHELFNTILESLKLVHRNKLLLHQELVEIIKTNKISNVAGNRQSTAILKAKKYPVQQGYLKNKIVQVISENEAIMSGINSLLKTSFFTGWTIFSSFNSINLQYSIINSFILLKTFYDLGFFFEKLPGEFSFLKKMDFIENRKQDLRENLAQRIECLAPPWLKTNFQLLLDLH